MSRLNRKRSCNSSRSYCSESSVISLWIWKSWRNIRGSMRRGRRRFRIRNGNNVRCREIGYNKIMPWWWIIYGRGPRMIWLIRSWLKISKRRNNPKKKLKELKTINSLSKITSFLKHINPKNQTQWKFMTKESANPWETIVVGIWCHRMGNWCNMIQGKNMSKSTGIFKERLLVKFYKAFLLHDLILNKRK